MYRSLSAATVPAASRGPTISAEGGYLCECGRDFDTEHGLKVHKGRFCKLRPPSERKADVMEVEDDDEYEEILADVEEMCSACGTVESVAVPRGAGEEHVGSVFVKFSDAAGARAQLRMAPAWIRPPSIGINRSC